MTKIKNTKKGMAKKTLSMSLVVAMLATSNVPVWAAEFSDGSDTAVATEAPAAEAFSDETAEAPVVDDTTANETDTVAATAVTEAGDLILDNVSISKKATFATGSVDVSGTIKYKDGSDVKELTNYSYGWRLKDAKQAIYTGTVTSGKTNNMGFTPDFAKASGSDSEKVDWSQYAGKTLELYVYNNETSDDSSNVINIAPTVIGETTINKCEIKGSLKLNKTSDKLIYNGKDFYLTSDDADTSDNAIKLAGKNKIALEVTGGDSTPEDTTWTRDEVLKFFDVNASKTAKNADDKLVVTATAKADSPYIGTVSAETLTVQKRPFNISEFELSVADGLSYQYTGNNISVPTDKVTLKEGADLSGADLSAAVKKAVTTDKTTGMQTVTVTLNSDKLPNFTLQNADKTQATTKANVEITKRDLNADSTSVTLKYGRVPKGTPVSVFTTDNLVFTDKTSGTALTLTNNSDYTISIKDPDNQTVTSDGSFEKVGPYEVTISAKETANPTCKNGQIINVRVASNVIGNAHFTTTYAPYYTGTALTPSKAELGKLVIENVNAAVSAETLKDDEWEITGYSNNINASTYKNGVAQTFGYIEIKVKGDSSYAGQTYKVPFEIKPLTVSVDSVTVPKTVTYNKGNGAASDYKVQLVVTAKDESGKIVKTLNAEDYTVKYEYKEGNDSDTSAATNELHDFIKATITIKNTNYVGTNGTVTSVEMPEKDSKNNSKWTEIVEKAITSNMIKINPSTYTYTGGNITPTFVVMDGSLVLYDSAEYSADKAEYKIVSITNNKNVGTGTVTVKGIAGKYSGTASANFTITPANTSDVKVTFTDDSECQYTGRQVRPRTFKATLNGNDVTDQFEIAGYGENISGKGTVTLKPVDGNKNFTGNNISADFNIVKEYVKADLNVYNSNGANVTMGYNAETISGSTKSFTVPTYSFDFDGTAKTFASEAIKNLTQKDGSATKAKESDFEVKYIDNISGKYVESLKSTSGNNQGQHNIAYVYVVAKDGTGYTGTKSFTTADGTTIKGVVDYLAFAIKDVEFVKQNVFVQNATYAGGLPVKPNVLVQINGNTLVEGKDYELTLAGAKTGENYTHVTDGKIYTVTVTGKGGYAGSKVENIKWGIDKKDIKNCDVKVVDGVVTVMNGYIPVPTTEYAFTKNSDGTYTVTANKDSKNYVGSKTVTAQGKAEDEKPDAPMISSVKVVGNQATAILSGDSEGAAGYDYVISTDRDCITNKDYDSVNKNQVQTSTTFKYVQQGTYYAYCHAWKRDANGKKVFSDWSNAYPFVVSAITPDAPVITNVKVSGSTIKVTYKAAANATGYDVVLGTGSKKENGETRPYQYGNHKKLNLKEGTVTATFKNVPKGTWVVGMHAFNRTSEDGKKVFSPWSNLKKATVK